jgi:hypothetical protein
MVAAKNAVVEHVLSLYKAVQPMHEPTVKGVLEQIRVDQGCGEDENVDPYARGAAHLCCQPPQRQVATGAV